MADRTELNVLNDLIAVCRDGEESFRFAAEQTTDMDLKDLFAALAEERHRYMEDLRPHAQRLGGQDGAGTGVGVIHRGLVNLQNAFFRHDDALIGGVARGERVAMRAYKEALEGMLPPTASDLIEEQYEGVSDAYERIVEMSNGRRAAA